jgi:hypothetical protein
VAFWMILFTYGPYGWYEKVSLLQMRTNWLCKELDQLEIPYFREEKMNIVTIRSEFIKKETAERFDLVPQKHNEENQWYKIVLMDHVEVDDLMVFIDALKKDMNLLS